MKNIPAVILILSAAFAVMACGKRVEAEKSATVVIERPVQQAPEPSRDGHLQRAGEKIDGKIDRKIDKTIDGMIE
jgi:hypothetical protein